MDEYYLGDEVDQEDTSEEGELLPDLYTEIATSLLYEVRFFDTFVFVRPATPEFHLAIKKMSHIDFASQFAPFAGDVGLAREMILGAQPDFIVGE